MFSALLPAEVVAFTSPTASMFTSPSALMVAPSTVVCTLFTSAVTASEKGRLPASAWVFTSTMPVDLALMSPVACSTAVLASSIVALTTSTPTASEDR